MPPPPIVGGGTTRHRKKVIYFRPKMPLTTEDFYTSCDSVHVKMK